MPFPGFLNVNKTNDVSVSLTNVRGRHTLKSGFYNTHSYKAQQRQGWQGTITFANDTTNPLDTGFGFANAAARRVLVLQPVLEVRRGQLRLQQHRGLRAGQLEGERASWTLDYGVRLVHQQPQYDELGQASNFLPEKWASVERAGALSRRLRGARPAPARTGRRSIRAPAPLLGPNTAVAIGTLVPNSGNTTNGLFLSGQGHRQDHLHLAGAQAGARDSAPPTT